MTEGQGWSLPGGNPPSTCPLGSPTRFPASTQASSLSHTECRGWAEGRAAGGAGGCGKGLMSAVLGMEDGVCQEKR